MRWILILIMGVVLVSGCLQQEDTTTIIIEKCKDLCQEKFGRDDISKGPCLSDDNPNWDVEDWVCDVAHDPRQDVDNLPENQCQAFRNGEAHHFVEIDPECRLIRAV